MNKRRTIERDIVLQSIRDVWGAYGGYVFDIDNLHHAVINGITYDIVDESVRHQGGMDHERTNDI